MTIGIWDAAAIAAWISAWLLLIGLALSFLGAILKRRRQRNEIYNKLRKSVATQEEFDKIARILKDGSGSA